MSRSTQIKMAQWPKTTVELERWIGPESVRTIRRGRDLFFCGVHSRCIYRVRRYYQKWIDNKGWVGNTSRKRWQKFGNITQVPYEYCRLLQTFCLGWLYSVTILFGIILSHTHGTLQKSFMHDEMSFWLKTVKCAVLLPRLRPIVVVVEEDKNLK